MDGDLPLDPGLTYRREPLRRLLEEPNARELISDHWEEVAEDKEAIPLMVEWDHYLDLADTGILQIWTARKDGRLVGYCCWYVDVHPHYGCLYAWASPFYLDPEHRKGLAGYKLLTAAEEEFKRSGVKRLVVREKVEAPLSPLFERAKYRLYERAWTRVL